MISRRNILRASLGLLAAPAIVRVAGIMPIKAPPLPYLEGQVFRFRTMTDAEFMIRINAMSPAELTRLLGYDATATYSSGIDDALRLVPLRNNDLWPTPPT